MFNTYSCKIHIYLTYLSIPLSTNILAVATIERAISICFPIKSKKWITKTRMRITIVEIVVLMFILHTPLLVDAYIDSTIDEHNCIFSEQPLGINWYLFDFISNVVVPFAIIFFGNVVIIWKLRLAASARTNLQGGARKNNSSTIMLVATGIAFFLTMTPLHIYYIGTDNDWYVAVTENESAKHMFVYALINLIMYMNNVLNFPMYCLSGSRFRRALFTLFWIKCRQLRSARTNI